MGETHKNVDFISSFFYKMEALAALAHIPTEQWWVGAEHKQHPFHVADVLFCLPQSPSFSLVYLSVLHSFGWQAGKLPYQVSEHI